MGFKENLIINEKNNQILQTCGIVCIINKETNKYLGANKNGFKFSSLIQRKKIFDV